MKRELVLVAMLLGLSGCNTNTPNQPLVNKIGTKCLTDMECGYPEACIKYPFERSGKCLTPVNKDGEVNWRYEKTDEIKISLQGQCKWDYDCPSGFSCEFGRETVGLCFKLR